MIDQAITELAPLVGVRAGCAAVGQAQARWYRRHRQSPLPPKPERVPAAQPRARSGTSGSGSVAPSTAPAWACASEAWSVVMVTGELLPRPLSSMIQQLHLPH